MPLIEYICPECNMAWNKRVPILSNDQNFQKCKRCGAEVPRQGLPSSVAIQRSGTSSATTDHIVGKDAATKWDAFHAKKEARDQVRKDLGTQALSQTPDGSYTALSPEQLKKRKEAYKFLNQ